ncbi:MAG: M28 family peptidase [Thermoguttaceae bacterium]|nr:M28 family peptidase [Thermoguttaceae bacterium]MDW8037403.1 M28 family peptidase [Thermoguttaceae bacterium]
MGRGGWPARDRNQFLRLTWAGTGLLRGVWILAWSACFWASGGWAVAEKRSASQAALDSISVQDLHGHVAYLADDRLEGRLAGTAGAQAAAEYLAQQLARLGLRPAGVDGSYFQPFGKGYRNVLAVLPGSDPKLRQEVIVIGAHYDHIGRGQEGKSRGGVGHIHNGADDNASGTAGLLELAQAFTFLPEPPKRTLLFAFWDAEELGALGSKHWVTQPTLTNHRVVFTLGLDMIGRLRQQRLTIFGTRTSFGLRRLMSQQNQWLNLWLDFDWKLAPNSDHYSFIEKKIPALLFHTGLHEDYHQPTDDTERIEFDGMVQVVRLAWLVGWTLANQEKIPDFRDEARLETPQTLQAMLQRRPELPLRLGVVWSEQEFIGPGVRLVEVVPGLPAAQAGLRPGDHLLRLNGQELHSGPQLQRYVMTTPRTVDLVVFRPGEQHLLKFRIELSGQPMQIGLLWRTDEAEPGAALVTYVVPGSPAAEADIRPGDYIYQLEDQPWPADEAELKRRLKAVPETIRLLVEREGRLRSVQIRLASPSASGSAKDPSTNSQSVPPPTPARPKNLFSKTLHPSYSTAG